MNIKIQNTALGGTVNAIASKSHAHRLLICAALADTVTSIVCRDSSEDIDATVRCLQSLGANISRDANGFQVEPIWSGKHSLKFQVKEKSGSGVSISEKSGSGVSMSEKSGLGIRISERPGFGMPVLENYKSPDVQEHIVLDCKESGTTLRFLLPISCALGSKTEFHMGGRLPSRPLSPLYEELEAHGCSLSAQGVSPLIAEGRLQSGTYKIPGNISSQYVSGLLFALPLLDGDSTINIQGELESKPYVELTLQTLSEFGISISSNGNLSEEGGSNLYNTGESGKHSTKDNGLSMQYYIKGNQKYHSPEIAVTEGDWSNAAFWLVAGAIRGSGVTCDNLNKKSAQGDREITKLLERFGAKVLFGNNRVSILPGVHYGIKINASNTPDLVPVLAAAAAVSEGRTEIFGAERLRHKESDRIDTVTQMLQTLGADISQRGDKIEIIGKKSLRGGVVSSFGDHRIAMTAAIIAAACENPVTIIGAEAVNKSYPRFFKDFAKLGGVWEEVE